MILLCTTLLLACVSALDHESVLFAPKRLPGGHRQCFVEKRSDAASTSDRRASTRHVVMTKRQVVIVPSVFTEYNLSTAPAWMREPAAPDVFLYQRLDAGAPCYAPNRGFEAGVHLQFIVEHYDRLPDVTVFAQDTCTGHQPKFVKMVRCFRGDMTWVSMNHPYRLSPQSAAGVNRTDRQGRPNNVGTNHCWRRMAATVGKPFRNGIIPRVGGYCCSQFAASRAHLRSVPRRTYVALLTLVLRSRICFEETGNPDTAYVPDASNTGDAVELTRDEFLYPAHYKRSKNRADADIDKGVAGVYEYMNHFLIGRQPWRSRRYTNDDLCAQFLPEDRCPGSPCKS